MNEINYIRLSALTRQIEGVIKSAFGISDYWIVAEISSHKFYPNQDRHYFEFIEKEEQSNDPVAKVRGVSWFSGSRQIKEFEKNTGQGFGNGIQVLVKVRVEFHPAYGLSLVLMDIDADFTLGNIEKQRRETLRRLVIENPSFISLSGEEYVTLNKKLPLNTVIQQIALIGSSNSEGYTDFIHTLQNNQYGYRFGVDTWYSSVQGTGAEREMVNCLLSIFNSGKKYDCVVFIRGGGAKTDFLVFDSYSLARTVAKFPIPVITGIGHHKDVSITDLMAHTSTKTPTMAAEFIISHCRQFEENILLLQKNIVIKSQGQVGKLLERIGDIHFTVNNRARTLIQNHRNTLVSLLNCVATRPEFILSNKANSLLNLSGTLKIFAARSLANLRSNLEHNDAVIRLMSPANILKRGFAIVYKNGSIIRDADRVEVGEKIMVTLNTSQIESNVVSKKSIHEYTPYL